MWKFAKVFYDGPFVVSVSQDDEARWPKFSMRVGWTRQEELEPEPSEIRSYLPIMFDRPSVGRIELRYRYSHVIGELIAQAEAWCDLELQTFERSKLDQRRIRDESDAAKEAKQPPQPPRGQSKGSKKHG